MSPLLVALRISLPLVALLAFLCGGLALFSVTSGPSPYLGVRGLRRVRSMQDSPLWARLEPAVRWLGERVRPLLGERARVKLDRQIQLAGDFWGLLPEELVALSALSMLGSATAAGAYCVVAGKSGALYVVLGAVLGAMLPYLHLSGVEQDRKKRIQHGLPSMIDLVSLALSAGLDFPGALRQVMDKSSNPNDALIEEVQFILHELSVGKTRKQALLQFGERVSSESVNEFVSAVVQAEERGNPLAQVLTIQAEASRQKRSVRAEETASRAGVKMFGPILIIFVVVMLLILAPLLMGLEDTLNTN